MTISVGDLSQQYPGWTLGSVYIDGVQSDITSQQFQIVVGNTTSVALKFIRSGSQLPQGNSGLGTIGNSSN